MWPSTINCLRPTPAASRAFSNSSNPSANSKHRHRRVRRQWPTFDGFENYHYTDLGRKYSVKLIDLDAGEVERVHVFDEKDLRPHAVRMSKLMLDPNSFLISAAKLKTHDLV